MDALQSTGKCALTAWVVQKYFHFETKYINAPNKKKANLANK